MPESDLVAYERRFRRAGLPLLIEDYSAAQDVFTRAVPLLTLVVLAELLGAVNLKWGFVANLFALIGGLVFVLALSGVINLLRGRRFFALPRSVGPVELVAFVVVPALLPIVFNGQETSAWRDGARERLHSRPGLPGDRVRPALHRALGGRPARSGSWRRRSCSSPAPFPCC